MSIPKQPFKAVIQRCLCGNPAEKRTGSGWSCMRCINSQKDKA